MSAYVDIVVEIFRLPVPQDSIGSLSFDTSTSSVMTVGPLIASNTPQSSSKVFNNIFE